LNLFKLLLY